jgi:hypothetical protein
VGHELEATRRQVEAMRRKVLRDLAQNGVHVEQMLGDCTQTAIRALIRAKDALRAKPPPRRPAARAAERPGPTPERLRQAGKVPEDLPNRGGNVAVRLARPIDAVQERLDAYEREAAERYYEAWAAAQGRSIVPDYAGARGGGGRITPAESALAAGQFVREVNARISPLMRQIAQNCILEQPIRPTDARPLSLEELGCLLRGTRDARAGKAAGYAYLHACCAQLAHAIAQWEGTKREVARQRRRA